MLNVRRALLDKTADGGRPYVGCLQSSRKRAAAASAVISRCGDPSISNPTINFRIVAERKSGG